MDLWKYVDDTALAEPVDDSKRKTAKRKADIVC